MQRFVCSWLGFAVLGWAVACGGASPSPSISPEPAPASDDASETAPAAPAPVRAQVSHDQQAEQLGSSQTPSTSPAPFATSRGRSLQWKRNAAFEADLMRGLELTRDEVCQELGSQSCIREVHTVALGGNDPFGAGLLRPATASLSTTPLVVDRVTLSACSQRARADKQGAPKVFTELDLSGPAPAAGTPEVRATITALFHRLLAREPKPNEVAALESLLSEDAESLSAEAFATLACFVVASSIEALFF